MKVLNFQENEIDYKEVDWESLEDEEDFPYLIRQKPGDENPLGRVKFMFPNNYSIYIHDSPAKHLFSVDERTFSSGCIRMEKAEEFASLLLENAGAWDAEKILEAMKDEEEEKVPLDDVKDVWILYLTVWGMEENMEVREDIYGMDRKLAEALSLPVSEYFL
jgi:murein L,D-transpeptidase YcbB/YkuD